MNSYYYLDAANQQQGPLDGNLLPSKGVTAQTLVWAQGMAEWTPAGQVAELQPLFQAAQPAQPPYQQPAQHQYQQPAQPHVQQTEQSQYQQHYGPAQYQQHYGPAQQPGAQGFQPKPDNYLVWAILTTICCCWPLGIVAIVYAAKVNNLYMTGQYQAAQEASANAKKWSIITAIGGAVVVLLYVIFYVIMGAAIVSGARW